MAKRKARKNVSNAPSRGTVRGGAKFRADQRLRSPDEFGRVYDVRCSVSDATLIVYGARNDCGRSRLGMSVSRKVGNAVTRNSWKRLIREAFRRHDPMLPVGLDIVVLPRQGSLPIWDNVQRSLVELITRVDRKLDTREKTGRPGKNKDSQGQSLGSTPVKPVTRKRSR